MHNRETVANTAFHLLSDFFARYGYWVVFFGVMLENIGVPVPGETVLLFAGFLAVQGKIHIIPAILTAIAGATIGACLGYWIGWSGGTTLINRLTGRFPRLRNQFESSQRTFDKHGQWAVFASRFITGLRVFAGFLAGALRMPFSRFFVFSFAGAICWAVAIGYVGYIFGDNWESLVHLIGHMNRIVLIVLAALALGYYVMRRMRNKSAA